MFSLGHFPFNDLTEPGILAKTSETSLAESGKGHQVIRGVKDMLCLAPLAVRYDQCSAAQATLGNWADNPEWRDDLTVESPWRCHNCGFMITAKEDGMSKSCL